MAGERIPGPLGRDPFAAVAQFLARQVERAGRAIGSFASPRPVGIDSEKVTKDWSDPPSVTPTTIPKLSALREKALALLNSILPAPYLSKNYIANPFHVKKSGLIANYSTCGEFPAYVVHLLGDTMHPGTTLLQPQGESRAVWVDAHKEGHTAWVVADGKRRPLPGDLYALCSGPKRDHTVAHVGVIVASSGTIWRTADWGQGGGFEGDFVNRTYDALAGTLAGEVDPKKGNVRPPRAIKGWVDLDSYCDPYFLL